jgi:hypothetical protein
MERKTAGNLVFLEDMTMGFAGRSVGGDGVDV